MQSTGLSCAHGDSSTRQVLSVEVTHSAFSHEMRGTVKGKEGDVEGLPRNKRLFS